MNKVMVIVNNELKLAFVTTNNKLTSESVSGVNAHFVQNYTHATPTQAHCKTQMLALTGAHNTVLVQCGTCTDADKNVARKQQIAQYKAKGFKVLNLR